MNRQLDQKTVSLVLGSGGARGLAHIGVIRYLQEQNLKIVSISGCSIGSLIGGVYAAGKLDQLESWMKDINKVDIARLLDPSWGKAGLFKGEKVIETLVDLLEDQKIEDLSIPFTAVAADINTEKEVWINSGSLFDAIRASVSLPLFFTPVQHKGAVLIDGGILNPVPIAPAFKDDSDYIIAVNLGGPIEKNVTASNSKPEQESNGSSIKQGLLSLLQYFNKSDQQKDEHSLGMYDVADKAFNTMQSNIARYKMATYPPDVQIEIARNACGTMEFDRAEEMIDLGYQKAMEAIQNAKM